MQKVWSAVPNIKNIVVKLYRRIHRPEPNIVIGSVSGVA